MAKEIVVLCKSDKEVREVVSHISSNIDMQGVEVFLDTPIGFKVWVAEENGKWEWSEEFHEDWLSHQRFSSIEEFRGGLR